MKEEIKDNINNMIPPELEEAKKLIDILIETKPNMRTTNLEYLERNKIVCPIDNNHHIKKNGHKNNTQRIWCYNCNKSFTITFNSIISHSSLNYYQLKKLLQCMYDYKSLTETALEVGISRTSVFEIEIKIFDALDELNYNTILSEIVQIDEKYVRTSFKGFPKEKMPRPSRYNGSTNLVSGISKDQVCIVVAIDTKDSLVIKVVGNRTATKDMISIALENKIEEGSTIVADNKNSYMQFAKDNNLKLKQIPKKSHMVDGYTINDVNEIMTEISSYLFNKRGVSSRHLQHHMNFIMYRKKIKYTIEYLERNEKMYVDMLTIKIKLKSNQVYSTDIPFDLEEYKEWYKDNYTK